MDESIKKHMIEKGYIIIPADNPKMLLQLRDQIYTKAKKIFQSTGTTFHDSDPTDFFNNFHNLGITGADLNKLRLQLINECTTEIQSGELIYKSFTETLLNLLGPDLLVQKTTNLVIQQPGDPNPSELHRDSPANSPYEIVVWLPLTDSYGTKAMYVLDKQESKEALTVLDKNINDWNHFEKHCHATGKQIPVPFGSALMFWPGLFHGSHINAEKETRWTLNMRFKNIFSPNGKKEPFEFFKILNISPLSQLALEYQKEEFMK